MTRISVEEMLGWREERLEAWAGRRQSGKEQMKLETA